jgi:hypothetical protein
VKQLGLTPLRAHFCGDSKRRWQKAYLRRIETGLKLNRMKSAKPKMPRSKGAPKRGPEPERLKLNGDWKRGDQKVIPKEVPPSGWPKLSN